MHPIFLPKVHAATKLTMQVRIPPPAPQASHFTGRGVRGTPRAQEGDPLPRRLTRPRRPLPLYGTFSTEDWALAVAKEAERHAAEGGRRCGRWAGSVRLRRASRSKTANRCPLNWVVKLKRRPERHCVGKALRVRPSVRPHAESSAPSRRMMMLVCAYSYIIGAINAAAADTEVLDPVFGQWSVRARTDRLICSGSSPDAGSCADAQINHSGAIYTDCARQALARR